MTWWSDTYESWGANTHLRLRVFTTMFPLVLQLHCIKVRALGPGAKSVPGFRPKVLQGTLNNLRWPYICNKTFFPPWGKYSFCCLAKTNEMLKIMGPPLFPHCSAEAQTWRPFPWWPQQAEHSSARMLGNGYLVRSTSPLGNSQFLHRKHLASLPIMTAFGEWTKMTKFFNIPTRRVKHRNPVKQ